MTAIPSVPASLSTLIAASAPDRSLSTAYQYSPRLQIVCIGDSITQLGQQPDGWLTLLASRFSRRADLFNRGYSGYTTKFILKLVTDHCKLGIFPGRIPLQPLHANNSNIDQIVTIAFGANDSIIPESANQLHVSDQEFASNIRSLITILYQYYNHTELPKSLESIQSSVSPPYNFSSGSVRFLLLTPPQVDPPRWAIELEKMKGKPTEIDRNWEAAKGKAEVVKRLAAEWRIPCVDQFSTTPLVAIQQSQGIISPIDYSCDGLHLSAEGNLSLFNQVVSVIKNNSAFFGSAYESLLDGPVWDLAASTMMKN